MKRARKFTGLYITLAIASLWATGCAHDQYRTDKQTTKQVQSALDQSKAYKYPGVVVTTDNGLVLLSGFVHTETEKQQAIETARQVPGVRSVQDSLVVRPDPTGRAPVIEPGDPINPPGAAPAMTNAAPAPSQNR